VAGRIKTGARDAPGRKIAGNGGEGANLVELTGG